MFPELEDRWQMSRTYRDFFPAHSKSSALAARKGFLASPESALLRTPLSAIPLKEKRALVAAALERKLHGIAFSPYMEGQKPGMKVSEEQIRERMGIIAPCCHWIRTFSCTQGNENAPRIAHEFGLKTMVGVSLGEHQGKNEMEFHNGVEVAASGGADILAVGNEVLLRGDMHEEALLAYIERAKAAVPEVPVGYVDAYFLFEKYPRVAAACDVILINCYPFWESCPIEYAVAYMKDMFKRAQAVAIGKRVIISETGWPSQGAAYGDAIPGCENAIDYFLGVASWAEEEGIEMFYFSSFDESWKVGDEGDVGAFWGLWDEHGHLKYV